MLLQTSLTNRRKFLERSALGASSLLFAPLLLDSCTDHVIPPNGPIKPPIVGDDDSGTDWNGVTKNVVTIGLQLVPDVGGFLGGLVGALWPDTQEDIWGEIKAQVEALVQEEIDETVYGLVSDQLIGLKIRLRFYQQALAANDPSDIVKEWGNTRDAFAGAQGLFQDSNNALLLLPLFVQYANLYLSILRDVVIDQNYNQLVGFNHIVPVFNRNPTEQQDDISNLQTTISSFIQYTNDTYNAGFADMVSKIPADSDQVQQFNTRNNFNRQMVLTVFDYMDTWQFYDFMKYPLGAQDNAGYPINPMPREIYSDAFGESANPISTPYPVPTQFPTHITVWGYDRIDGVQVTYPVDPSTGQGGGPLGVTTTPRMGDQNGGQNYTYGGEFNTDINNTTYGPITQARTRPYQFIYQRNDVPCVYTLQFMYNNGTTTNQCGGANYSQDQEHTPNVWVSYTNHALSSVYIPGVSSQYGIGSANCIIFGFRYWQSPDVTLNAIRAHYIKSPKEKSVADFAKSFPKLGITAALITDELKALRKAYWERMKTR